MPSSFPTQFATATPVLFANSTPVLLRAELRADAFHQLLTVAENVAPPSDLIARADVHVPIAPGPTVEAATIFTDPQHGDEQAHLPSYELVRERLCLESSPTGWSLTVELLPAAHALRAVEHELTLELRYPIGATGAVRALSFGERTPTEHGVSFVARGTDPSERDLLYDALSHNVGATLVVARTLTVAVPVEVSTGSGSAAADAPPAIDHVAIKRRPPWFDAGIIGARFEHGIEPIEPMRPANAVLAGRIGGMTARPRRPPLGFPDVIVADPIDIVIADPVVVPDPAPPAPPATVTMYRIMTLAFDQTVAPTPFFFPPELNPHVYAGSTAGPGTGSIALQRVFEAGHDYFRQGSGSTYYYLPDDLRLVRRTASPHIPLMSLTFANPDGADTTVAFEFAIAPYTESKRLDAARAAFVAATGLADVTLQPLSIRSDLARISIDLGGDPTQDRTAVTAAAVDLTKGFTCRVNLPVARFQPLYDALFGGALSLFTGSVEIQLSDTDAVRSHHVPFNGRLDEAFCAVSVLDVETVSRQADGTTVAEIVNAIESPIDVSQVRLIGRDGAGAEVIVSVASTDPALPMTLPPGAPVSVTMTAAAGGSPPERLEFQAGGVKIVPDPSNVYDAILNRFAPAGQLATYRVKVRRSILNLPAGSAPGRQITELEVDLEDGDTVIVQATDAVDPASSAFFAPQSCRVRVPLKDRIVPSEAFTAGVRYRLRALRQDGTQDVWSEWNLEDSGTGEVSVTSYLPGIAA